MKRRKKKNARRSHSSMVTTVTYNSKILQKRLCSRAVYMENAYTNLFGTLRKCGQNSCACFFIKHIQFHGGFMRMFHRSSCNLVFVLCFALAWIFQQNFLQFYPFHSKVPSVRITQTRACTIFTAQAVFHVFAWFGTKRMPLYRSADAVRIKFTRNVSIKAIDVTKRML